VEEMISEGFFQNVKHSLTPADERTRDDEARTHPVSPTRSLSSTDSQSTMSRSRVEEAIAAQWSANMICQVEMRLARNITDNIGHYALDFATPPTKADTSPGTLLLNPDSPLNTIAVEHEQWLIDHRNIFSSLADKYSLNRPLLGQISSTRHAIESELNLLKNVKLAEWRRQRQALVLAGTNLVDSRE
jgi:hypothetical protein